MPLDIPVALSPSSRPVGSALGVPLDTFLFPQTPALDFPAKYIGVKWVWRGRDLQRGLDCHGLLLQIYRHDLGVDIPDYLSEQTAQSEPARTKQSARLIKTGIAGWAEVSRPALGVGILFRTANLPVHVGVCVGGGDFLHSCETIGHAARECISDHTNNILGYFVPRQTLVTAT